jgi:hypothetical protein
MCQAHPKTPCQLHGTKQALKIKKVNITKVMKGDRNKEISHTLRKRFAHIHCMYCTVYVAHTVGIGDIRGNAAFPSFLQFHLFVSAGERSREKRRHRYCTVLQLGIELDSALHSLWCFTGSCGYLAIYDSTLFVLI